MSARSRHCHAWQKSAGWTDFKDAILTLFPPDSEIEPTSQSIVAATMGLVLTLVVEIQLEKSQKEWSSTSLNQGWCE